MPATDDSPARRPTRRQCNRADAPRRVDRTGVVLKVAAGRAVSSRVAAARGCVLFLFRCAWLSLAPAPVSYVVRIVQR